MNENLERDLRQTAMALADAARTETLAHFRRSDLAADNKDSAGFDPVTEADRAAERRMRAILAKRRPDDAVLGEELAATPGTSGLTWILDPVDGTRGFLAGTPTWGVLIAVADARGPLFGVIDQPYIGERFWGGFGSAGMTGPQGERTLRSRASRPLDRAILCSTFPEIGSPEERATFERLAEAVRLTRFGMDCYAYALLAAGHIDLVVEAGLHVHDIAAPIAIIEAAGGCVTTWDGGPARSGGRIIAAANPAIHERASRILRSRP